MIELSPRIVAKIAFGDCWEWTGARSDGYGHIRSAGAVRLAHRVVWETLVGPVPEGMELDHLCRNRGCVNPDHMQVVTHRTNGLRGYGAAGQHARKALCPRGHPYDMIVKNGGRTARGCLRCQAAKTRRYAAKKKVQW